MPAISPEMRPLFTAAEDLAARLGATGGDSDQRASARLHDSVIRPLRQATRVAAAATAPGNGQTGPAPGPGPAEPSGKAPTANQGDELWELARAATALRARFPEVPELAEATAALQDLAIGAAGQDVAESRLAELAALQAGLGPGIQAMADGPYLVTGARALVDWLGQPLPVRPQLALCRCGGSKIKPLCDAIHAATGFTGDKDAGRVPDRRDTYPGQQVTIFDKLAVRALGLASPLMRGLAEMSYQFDEPFVLDTSKYEAAFGAAGTPLAAAVAATVAWYRTRPGTP